LLLAGLGRGGRGLLVADLDRGRLLGGLVRAAPAIVVVPALVTARVDLTGLARVLVLAAAVVAVEEIAAPALGLGGLACGRERLVDAAAVRIGGRVPLGVAAGRLRGGRPVIALRRLDLERLRGLLADLV